ncbi:response regulator, partial [Acidimicrobiaceae bacterium USS-CC1]|nr:response regulator [Acidiferrimicrobium australe]
MATVLVVDDERDICELVRINLELDGHRVAVAHDGDAALTELERVRPDLLILDVMMPGRDGFSVLQG